MKHVIFYALFWMFSTGFNASDNTTSCLLQTFSKVHVSSVTESASVRLKEIDVANPLFIFK
jgi:hypothetical protein